MLRSRAVSLACALVAGTLLLTACNGDDEAAGAAAEATSKLAFQRGTATENEADRSAGDFAAAAAPAAAATARRPVIRKWVQLSAGSAGDLDPVTVNGKGFTLYRFDKDTSSPSRSHCTGKCATTWPPYLVARDGRVFIDGIDKSKIGFIERDGGFQVTLGGWPVYLFSKDVEAGDTNGQGVDGVWFGVTPDGGKAQGGTAAGGAADETGGAADGASPQESPQASPTSDPAGNATLFEEKDFLDSSQGVSGPGCQNVRFDGSLQTGGGFVKVWEGPDCTGASRFVEGDVKDLLGSTGLRGVRSVRFFD
ncbi:hypothetical protein ACFU96_28220 [Streptomyces sp. NPDC057620]|uniref:hypothetical protein n=1 Tax=Streptomyces sp. NPDC057620 TaxID=3346185 RepID=UPI0036BC5E32